MKSKLSTTDFNIIKEYLVTWTPKIRLGSDESLRLFLDACLWFCYTGARYRELPKYFGNWNSVYKRYSDWGNLGVWKGLLKFLVDMDSDFEFVMVDSTVVRAHACCSTGKKKKLNQKKGLVDQEAVSQQKFI